MTYRLQMQGEAKRLERDQQARSWLAWQIARLGRVKDFPPLHELTGVKPVVHRQTPAEMKAVFAALRAARDKPGS